DRTKPGEPRPRPARRRSYSEERGPATLHGIRTFGQYESIEKNESIGLQRRGHTLHIPTFSATSGSKCAVKCLRNSGSLVIFKPRTCSRPRITSSKVSATYSIWLCVYTRRGIASRTRSIAEGMSLPFPAYLPNITEPISTVRRPASLYNSHTSACPGY